MPPIELHAALEALLFSSDQPLPVGLITESLDIPPDEVIAALQSLGESYVARGAGVQLREIAGGWMLVTAPEQAEWVGRLLRGKRKLRLSRAALETMAIIAYKQPVTKAEVEAIRGVDSSGVLATLLERNLVTIRGRSKVVGRPLLYGTTQDFLEYFGLRDLSELPRPEELRALVAAREPEQLEMMELEVVSQVASDLAAAEAAGEAGTHHEVVPIGDDDRGGELAEDEESFDDDDEFEDEDEDEFEDEDEDDEDTDEVEDEAAEGEPAEHPRRR
jgi:segregation and condensation protein B